MNEYVCPCHGAHYTKDGKNLVVAPKPLDEYDLKVENGWIYLGPVKAEYKSIIRRRSSDV